MGYLRIPPAATGTDVSKRLETSHSAVVERLRWAERSPVRLRRAGRLKRPIYIPALRPNLVM
ncbi:hypothetical protein [Natrinema caseinilyticum]|uniref:hypothetical protein n=1 Tax=Natrinema caseinilyticum TaxID=2961570 RepID=UPI003CCCA4CE